MIPKQGDRVTIGGQTRLGDGTSLAGSTGVVIETAPNAPRGCLTVELDEEVNGFAVVNVMATCLTPLKPTLRII